MWGVIEYLCSEAYDSNIVAHVSLQNAVSMDVIMQACRTLIERHEALRTSYYLDGDGRLIQRVHTSGTIDVEIVNFEDADGSFDRYVAEISGKTFDLGSGNPVTFAVLCQRSIPQYLIIVISHLSADKGGADILRSEFSSLLQRNDSGDREVDGQWHPLDQAGFEQSDAGKRLNELNLSRLQEDLVHSPQVMLAEPGSAGKSPRYWSGVLRSKAAYLAVQVLSERHKLSAAAIVLAATAIVVGDRSGTRSPIFQIASSNRHRPGLRYSVGSYMQYAPVVIDVTENSFFEIARQARMATLRANRYAQFDPAGLAEIRRITEVSRRSAIDLSCFFNFRGDGLIGPPRVAEEAAETAPAALRSLVAESVFEWIFKGDYNDVKYYSFVSTSGPDVLLLGVDADTFVLAPHEIEECLRTTEEVLINALDHDGVRPSSAR